MTIWVRACFVLYLEVHLPNFVFSDRIYDIDRINVCGQAPKQVVYENLKLNKLLLVLFAGLVS